MTRLDDVINTCGHRISTGRLEEVVNQHECVVESAVIGFDEDLRGECPLAYVVLKGTGVKDLSEAELTKISASINNRVRDDVGPFARLIGVIFVEKLPKTRSGKILRGTIRNISNAQQYAYPATIDDPTALELISSSIERWKASLKK
jgi:propionyl-CoA synthetase